MTGGLGADRFVIDFASGLDTIVDAEAGDVLAYRIGALEYVISGQAEYDYGDYWTVKAGGQALRIYVPGANGALPSSGAGAYIDNPADGSGGRVFIPNFGTGKFNIPLEDPAMDNDGSGANPFPLPAPGVDDGAGGGAGGGFDEALRQTPIALDLDGDGLEYTALRSSNAFFDIDGDGFAERVEWVGGDDGFLVRDLNGNGRIDNIGEMFGDQGGTSAYQKLAALNSNGDAALTAANDNADVRELRAAA